MYAWPWNGRAWCSQSEKNSIGPSMTWLMLQSGPPWHSVGKAVRSFGSPSYPLVASKSARRNRVGVDLVPGVSRSIPNAWKISPAYPSNFVHCSGLMVRGRTFSQCVVSSGSKARVDMSSLLQGVDGSASLYGLPEADQRMVALELLPDDQHGGARGDDACLQRGEDHRRHPRPRTR